MKTSPPRRAGLPRLPWRPILAALALFALLATLLPLAATRLVGQETLRETVQDAMAQALGRPVAIGGDVRLTLLPRLGLRAGSVSIAGEAGREGGPLLVAGEMAVGLDVWALLGRQVVVETVSLEKPVLSLERDASGRPNWALPGLEASGRSPGSRGPGLPRGLRLEDGRVDYIDRSTGLTLAVQRLNLQTTASRPFKFSVSFSAQEGGSGFSGEFHAKGLGSYGEEDSALFVHKSQVAGWLALPGKETGGEGRVLFSGDVMVHGQGAVEVANLALEGLGARVTGQVNAAGLLDANRHLLVDVRAEARRGGAWREFVRSGGLAPRPVLAPVPSEPALRAPDQADAVRARLKLAVTPSGWTVLEGSVREGGGVVQGTARKAAGEAAFDVTAHGIDISSWADLLNPAGFLSGAGASPRLAGRFRGKALRLGGVEIYSLDLSAAGAGKALRVYPLTARLDKALVSADIRLSPEAGGARFAASAGVQALEGAHPQSGLAVLDASALGQWSPGGAGGTLRLETRPLAADWRPAWMPEPARKLLDELGSVAAQASFRTGDTDKAAWELTDLDARLGQTSLSGGLSWASGTAVADLRLDRLNLEQLRRVDRILGAGDGPAPVPLDLKLAVKRLEALKGLDVDDLSMALRATSDALRFSGVSGAALGGRFSGGLDVAAQQGACQLTLAVQGVQGAKLRELFPAAPRFNGPLDARLALEAPWRGGEPVWKSAKGQAELTLGQGAILAQDARPGTKPWPVSKASAQVRFALKPSQNHGADRPRETAVLELAGPLRVESPANPRSSHAEIKATAGLDESGGVLWVRQPRVEAVHTLVLPFLHGRPLRAAWSGRLEADLERGAFALTGVEADLGGTPAKGSLSGQPGQASMALSGGVDVPEFNPRDAAARLGVSLPQGAGHDAWRRARFSAEVGGSVKEPALGRIQAVLDEATATGQASLSGQRLRLNLDVNGLDLDKLAPEKKHPDITQRPDEPLPMQELRELDLDARIRMGRLVKDRLVWENALVEVQAQGGRFLLRQSAPSFYGGPYSLEVRGDARGEELHARIDINLTGFSAPVLLRDLADGSGLTQGTTNFRLGLNAHGSTTRTMRKGAEGEAVFEVFGGVLAIPDADGRPQKNTPAPGMMPREDAPGAQQARQAKGLAFTRMGASFSVRQGLGVTRDFVLVGNGITAKGDGWVSLVDERIDLNLMAQVPDVGEVPVRISGPLYDPKLDVDKSRIIGDTIVNVFKGLFNIPGDVLNQFRRVF